MIHLRKFQHFAFINQRIKCCFALSPFPLPDLGQKIKQGRIKKFYVQEGDRVEEFQKLADVQSDKQFTEITSPQAGLIKKLYYKENQICQVGDILLDIDSESTKRVQVTDKKIETKPQVKIQAKKVEEIQHSSVEHAFEGILTSPTVIKWSKQNNVDLALVKGTGKRNRILKEDIIHYIQQRKNNKNKTIQGINIAKQRKQSKAQQITKVSMNTAQKSNQIQSLKSVKIPHLYLQQTFQISQFLNLQRILQQRKRSISLLSLLIKTFSVALKKYPRMNSTYNQNFPFQYQKHSSQNILIINDSNYQLLQGIQSLSALAIEQALYSKLNSGLHLSKDLIDRSTICFSQTSGLSSNPLILGNTVCHANIGKVRQLPKMKDTWTKSSCIEVTLGCDHRVLDGASVARFTNSWRELVQTPSLGLLYMI